jgi:uncharacterized protein YoxC
MLQYVTRHPIFLKRKFKTLSGSTEWKLEDVHEVLQDIQQKYGHINPLFSISGNP